MKARGSFAFCLFLVGGAWLYVSDAFAGDRSDPQMILAQAGGGAGGGGTGGGTGGGAMGGGAGSGTAGGMVQRAPQIDDY